jgi:hypothetical protein
MYPPYNLPPINPAAFGGQPQQQGPQGAPPPSSQGGGQPPMDMNKYLIDKVMEIKSGWVAVMLVRLVRLRKLCNRSNRSNQCQCQCHNRVRNA